MQTSDCELLWRQIHERLTTAAMTINGERFPALSAHARAEATSFSGLALPATGHEMNLRRVAAGSMVARWTSESSRMKSI